MYFCPFFFYIILHTVYGYLLINYCRCCNIHLYVINLLPNQINSFETSTIVLFQLPSFITYYAIIVLYFTSLPMLYSS